MASAKPKLAAPPKAHLPSTRQKIAQVAFGHVQGKRQSSADTQIAALLRNYNAQQKQSAAYQKAFGLRTVEGSTGTGRPFHSQSSTFHRYP